VGEQAAVVHEHPIHHLDRFVEKPDHERAEAYLADGGYLWNAGIFAWRASDLLAEIAAQLPRLGEGLDELAASFGRRDEAEVLARVYPSLPRISVDFGVMEGAGRRWVLPVSFPWSDVGSWSALPEVLPPDATGNVSRGRVLCLDSSGNVAVADGPAIALLGVHQLIVVATDDAVLVAPKDSAQRVKELVDALGERGWQDLL
jgi:mannose-1-phosphate guanylyltransferase